MAAKKKFEWIPKTKEDFAIKEADAKWDKAISDFNAGNLTEEAFDKIMAEVGEVQSAWLRSVAD